MITKSIINIYFPKGYIIGDTKKKNFGFDIIWITMADSFQGQQKSSINCFIFRDVCTDV